MRFVIAGVAHESNSFSSVPTRYEDFTILDGEQIIEQHTTANSTLTGYLKACREAGVEAVPVYAARATPSGPVTAEAFERLTTEMVAAIKAAGPIDGVLMYQHGAHVADGQVDADGEITRRAREAVGVGVPIAVTLDMHANVSEGLIQHSDVLVVWRTNPHVDADVRAFEAATLAIRQARGEVTPTQALVQVPAAINILRQDTSLEPMASLVAELEAVAGRDDVLSASLAEGYPWADAHAMGMATVVITDDDADLAHRLAQELAAKVWDAREDFLGEALSPADAVAHVAGADRTPVLILDVGDNVGGGSEGDSVSLLNQVLAQDASGFVATVADADAAEACRVAGVGGRVEVTVGASVDPSVGPPVALVGTVLAVTDGRFEDAGPTHGGGRFYNAGTMAALDIGNDNVVVFTSRAMGTHSPEQFRSLGLEPTEFRAIIAKGVNSPMAGFRPLAGEIIYADTPGCTAADISTLSFQRRRVPMFPFEPDTVFALPDRS